MTTPDPRTPENSFDHHPIDRIHTDAERTLRDSAGDADDDVLSVVAHDLRDPMNTVMMSTSLLNDPNIQLTDEQRSVQFAVIERAIQRMNRLILKLAPGKREHRGEHEGEHENGQKDGHNGD
jgi:K+-sensing histidine kinase KdpD